MKNIKSINEFLNEELIVLKGPSDEDVINILKKMKKDGTSAEEISEFCVRYKLGDIGFDYAIKIGSNDPHFFDYLLFDATDAGLLKYVKIAIEKGANVNYKGDAGWTPLMSAVSEENIEIIKYLIAHGANPYIKNNIDETSFYIAIHRNNKEIIDILKSSPNY